jgi:hypothetical protein
VQRKGEFYRADENSRLPKKSDSMTLTLNAEQLEALTQTIRSYDPNYGQLVVRDVVRAQGCCWARVRGFNDRFCLNKCALHTSNQIYFELTGRGIRQRCYSHKAEVRVCGFKCSDFKGPLKLMPAALVALLGDGEASTPVRSAEEQSRAKRPAAKRHKPNSSELVCYGGYHQITPDVYL